MASRTFSRLQALQKEVKHVHAKVAIGGTGAPTLVTANGSSLGVASVVRDGAGTYTVTLEDKYPEILFFDGQQVLGAAQDVVFHVSGSDPLAKTLTFYTLTAATPTDPTNGSELWLRFELKNTTVK